MKYELTEHCKQRMQQRNILLEWVEKALFEAEKTESHPKDNTLECRYARIPAMGDRVLKVVYNFTTTPIRVVTVHFDRGMGGKLGRKV